MAKKKRTEKKKPTRAIFFAVATHSPKMCDRVRKQNKEQLLLLFESIEVNLDVAQTQKTVLLGTARILGRVLDY